MPLDERWKMVAEWDGADNASAKLDLVETRAFGSADGIHWRHLGGGPMYAHSDTQNVAFWSPLADAGRGAYVAFRRLEATWVGTKRPCAPCVVAQTGNGEAARGYCGPAALVGHGLARVVAMCEGKALDTGGFEHCTPTNRSNIVFGPDNIDSPCVDFCA